MFNLFKKNKNIKKPFVYRRRVLTEKWKKIDIWSTNIIRLQVHVGDFDEEGMLEYARNVRRTFFVPLNRLNEGPPGLEEDYYIPVR